MSSLNHFSPIQTTTPLTETPFLTESALNERQVLLKFVLIGDSSTGKTSIINKFLSNTFTTTYAPTSTNNYNPSSEQIIINCNNDEMDKKYIIQLQLWDTSGIFPSNSNINIPSTIHESSLASKKHPKSCHSHINIQNPIKTDTINNTNNNNNTNNITNCVQSKTENCKSFHSIDPFDMDLPLFFDEMDEKEAMENELINSKPSHIKQQQQQTSNSNKDGYSSSSSMDHSIQLEEQILFGKQFDSSNIIKPSKRHFDELIFNNLDALILVYDITNKQSLIHLNAWLELFATNTINSNELPILVIGNKNDLISQNDGPNETISNYIRQGKIFTQQLCNPLKLFKSISAKTLKQSDIKQIFIQLAQMCINTQSSILQLTSNDSISSRDSVNYNQRKTTYKRMQRSDHFAIKTCAQNFCGNSQAQNTNDQTFCVIL